MKKFGLLFFSLFFCLTFARIIYAQTLTAAWINEFHYDNTGNLDASFGSGGIVISSGIGKGYFLGIQSDEKILLAGDGNGVFADFVVARYIQSVPEITLISPNGDEEWCAGTTETIIWTQNFVGNATILLLKGDQLLLIISSSTAGDGEFDWSVPQFASGSDYKIKILSVSDGNIFDISDSSFSIIGGEITVISPNGGEVWYAGTTETIIWTSNCVGNVSILLLKNDQLFFIFSSSTANDGSMTWTVPSGLTGSGFKIRISSVDDGNIGDESDADFTITDVTGIGDLVSSIPESYKLLQNYPNPFNPSTTIYYGLPEESSVKITIYDVLGNEMMVYSEEKQEAGYHRVEFDATELPSGIYFYQLQAGVFVEAKKMLLLK